MPALLNAVRELVAFDSAEFAWVDARGEMTNLYAEPLLPPDVMHFYFHRGETTEHPVALTFRLRAALADPVSTFSVTDSMRHTEIYCHVLKHLGAEHVLYCVIRDRGQALGQLSLYRGASGRHSARRTGTPSARSPATSRTASAIRSRRGATRAPTRAIATPNSRRC